MNITDSVLTLIEGANATLGFTIDANPRNTPTLVKNGGGDLNRVMLSEGLDAIEFCDIRSEDGGLYTLSMTNDAGTTTENIFLIVQCKILYTHILAM